MSSSATSTVGLSSKPIHSLVLDTGPLIKNDPPASTLLAKAEQLYILPSIVPEIRDAATRTRVETTLLPFVTLRSPKPDSIKIIQDFARRTGDLDVLSRPDVQALALTYELELERNGGDWRLRKTPGQKTLNGRPDGAKTESATHPQPDGEQDPKTGATETSAPAVESVERDLKELDISARQSGTAMEAPTLPETADASTRIPPEGEKADETVPAQEAASDSDSDSDGWITPSNLKKQQNKDSRSAPDQPAQRTLQAALLTSDFAMQNVALRMNLNLVAPSLARITQLKNWVLRCHGCFHITKDTSKQFCPSCGQSTLIRTSCSTDDRGNFKIHLKKNFQWNNRGNVYSVPKPVHGSANGRLPKQAGGGGKNGWGTELMLAEDQKEYVRATDEQKRARKKDLMDEDYLPGILSGDRSGTAGRIRVGPGRNVNSRKKR